MGGIPFRAARTRARVLASACAVALAFAFVPRSEAAPAPPTIADPDQNSLEAGAFPTKVKISGAAPAGHSIEVSDAVRGSLGSSAAGSTGAWSLPLHLSGGLYTVSAVATDPADGSRSPVSATVSFEVDDVRPSVRVTAPEAGHVFKPAEEVAISGDAVDAKGILAIQVEYWLLNKLILKENAACSGCGTGTAATWTDTPTLPYGGYYYVRAHSIDAAGNRSDTGTTTFVATGIRELPVRTPVVAVPTIEVPKLGSDQPGAGGNAILVGGRARPGSRVSVFEVFEGLGLLADTTAKQSAPGAGTWSVTVHLTGGRYGIRVVATDAQGRVSPLSATVLFFVDDVRPVVEVQANPEVPVYLPTEPVTLEGSIGDDRVVAAVRLEFWLANQMVHAAWAVCPACWKDTEAAWSYTASLPKPGYYYVKVKALDRAGNPSTTAVVTFVKAG